MNDQLAIRPATEADVPLVLDFIRQLAIYEKLEDKAVATPELLHRALFGQPRYAEVIIAEREGRPTGFALFFHTFSTFLGKPGIYLEDLFVLPEERGRGTGKALLVELARIARSRDCGRVEWSVLNWNESAIGFYRSLGAVPMDEWTVYRLSGDALTGLAE
jgi:GNAT superfamily N-acetyltransferase